MRKAKTLIVIDVNNLCHRNHHALAGGPYQRPIIYGMLRDIGKLASTLGSLEFVFCFDSNSSIRKEVYPSYKAGRNNTDKEKIDKEIHLLHDEILPHIGYQNLLLKKGAEADDLIAWVRECSNRDIIIVSNDTDLYQLVDCRTVIWNPQSKTTIDANWIYRKHSVHPEEWIEFKAMVGCKTDNVPGVPGMGAVLASKFLRGVLTERIDRNITDNQEVLSLSKKLVTLPFPDLTLGKFKLLKDSITYDRWVKTVSHWKMSMLISQFPRC